MSRGRTSAHSFAAKSPILTALIVSPGFAITVRRLGVSVTTMMKVTDTIDALRAQWPDLPGREDVELQRPPTGRRWSRVVPETSLAVLYLSGRHGMTLLAVKVRA